MSPAERADLVGRARIRNYPAGETIFLMGSSGDSMMAVLDGTIRISVPSPEGKEIVLAIIQPGEVFGEIALLDGKERTAEATVMTDCTLAVLERRDVLSFLEATRAAGRGWSSCCAGGCATATGRSPRWPSCNCRCGSPRRCCAWPTWRRAWPAPAPARASG